MSKRSSRRAAHVILDRLEEGEEFFLLRGKDRATPISIRVWAHIWLQEIRMGARPESDRKQVTEGLAMATRMEIRLRDQQQKREHAAIQFDAAGVPLTGPHAKLAHNTTSGANDAST